MDTEWTKIIIIGEVGLAISFWGTGLLYLLYFIGMLSMLMAALSAFSIFLLMLFVSFEINHRKDDLLGIMTFIIITAQAFGIACVQLLLRGLVSTMELVFAYIIFTIISVYTLRLAE